MDKDSRDKRFIRKPIFKGGNKEFSKFIYSNLKYPKAALENKIEGTVIIRYDIDHQGNVVKTKVLSSLSHECDEEAVRVIKLLKFDIPKGPRKLRVIFHRTTKVKFVLSNVKSKVVKPRMPASSSVKGTNLTYQYTKKAKVKKVKALTKPKQAYTYNISW